MKKTFSLLLSVAPAAAASGAVVINGVSFVDRGAPGDIFLGMVRGAASVIDYDGDGHPDLAIADIAGKPYRIYRNIPDPSHPGNRTFANVTAGSGLDDADGVSRAFGGVVAADYDNDGDTDLYFAGFLNLGTRSDGVLYRNDSFGDGDATFTNVSIAAGVRGTGNTPESVSWTDFDLDGWVDLMVVNMAPSNTALRLLRNNRDGTFTDVSSIVDDLPIPSHCYSHLWSDFDLDGDPDCILIQNSNPPSLLRNDLQPDGERLLHDVGLEVGYLTLGPAPMGIAAGDFDNDGDPEYAITDADTGTYYRNNGDGTLTRFFPFTTFFGWGVTWLDVDNDGDLDNYQAGSWGTPAIDRLTLNQGGGWLNAQAALNTTLLASQHTIRVDFNSDGRDDLITGNPNNRFSVYENVSEAGHWLRVALSGDGVSVNRSAIGAVIRVYTAAGVQVREIQSGSTLSATEDQRALFGLGELTGVSAVEVVWPRAGSITSRTQTFVGPIAAGQTINLAPAPLADLNFDGAVNGADLGLLLAEWGDGDLADLNDDGAVDGSDLGLLLAAWTG